MLQSSQTRLDMLRSKTIQRDNLTMKLTFPCSLLLFTDTIVKQEYIWSGSMRSSKIGSPNEAEEFFSNGTLHISVAVGKTDIVFDCHNNPCEWSISASENRGQHFFG